MIRLRPVLAVRELPPAAARLRRHLPSITDFTAPAPGPGEAMVVSYLRQGAVCGLYPDPRLLYDVLQPGQRIEPFHRPESEGAVDGTVLLTDGAWVWSGALPYYVATYHLRLPAEFLEHAARQQWRIDPAAIKLGELNSEAFDAISAAAPSPVRP
jgi:hypothetical protein